MMHFLTSALLIVFSSQFLTVIATSGTYQSLDQEQNTNVQLNCSANGEQYADVTVKWSKQQDADPMDLYINEKKQTELPPTNSKFGNYVASHTTMSNGFMNILSITNLQPEDSANYICSVIDSNGNTQVSVNYTVNAIDPTHVAHLMRNESDINSTRPNSFHYIANRQDSIGCHVSGGNPAANITIIIVSDSSNQFKGRFNMSSAKTWSGSMKGFKRPSWDIVVLSNEFLPVADYDNAIGLCWASIHSHNNTNSSTLMVDGVPFFHGNACQPVQRVQQGAAPVIKCRFHARPVGGATWTAGKTNNTQDHNPVDATSQQLLDGANDYIAQVQFAQMSQAAYQMYNLSVSNDYGSNSTLIQLAPNGKSANRCDVYYFLTTVISLPVFAKLAMGNI